MWRIAYVGWLKAIVGLFLFILDEEVACWEES